MNKDDPEVRVAVFGRQVALFLESDIGKYLLQRSEKQAIEAMAELETVSPWRKRRIRDLQNRVYVSKSIRLWLAEAIQSGVLMAQKLEQDRE